MNLIDKYIHAVVTQLPESQREDVGKELKSNILDMLSDEPSDLEIKKALESMGDPSILADGYRGKERYLIGPRVFNDYIRTLKIVVPIVVAIAMAFSLIETLLSIGTPTTTQHFVQITTSIISSIISAPLFAITWITVAFATVEYFDVKRSKQWHIDSLDLLPDPIVKPFPLSDSVAEIGFSIFFLLGIYYFAEYMGVYRTINGELTMVAPLFNTEMLPKMFPLFLAMTLIVIVNALFKLKTRRWTSSLLITNITVELVSAGLFLYVFLFTPFVNKDVVSAITPDVVSNQFLYSLFNAMPAILTGLVIFFTLYNCYKYYRDYKKQQFITY